MQITQHRLAPTAGTDGLKISHVQAHAARLLHPALIMSSSKHPEPPKPLRPIVVKTMSLPAKLRESIADWQLFKTFLDAAERRDFYTCLAAAGKALWREEVGGEAQFDMVATVSNMAAEMDERPSALQELLTTAVDRGMHAFAYNAANLLLRASKTPTDHKVAEHYFKIAMAFSDDPAMQAAAFVNYCPILRDGLISGKPDWPAAVAIYEVAAGMGLLRGMFNAGNMSMAIAQTGDRMYAARAAKWFTKVLEVHAAGVQTLDVETLAELQDEADQAAEMLAELHIKSMFDGASAAQGTALAQGLARRNLQSRANFLAHLLGERIAALDVKPAASPGANWRTLLETLGWQFAGPMTQAAATIDYTDGPETLLLDQASVRLVTGATMPLFVTHAFCLPLRDGIHELVLIARSIARLHPAGFLLLTRRAFFQVQGNLCYVPIYVWRDGRLARQCLWIASTPDLLLQQAKDGVAFFDPRYGTDHCMLPIAANALDEGFIVAKHTKYAQPYVEVGDGWCMPYVSLEGLAALQIQLAER